jgi:hypothetical protein
MVDLDPVDAAYRELPPPFASFREEQLGPDFAASLALTSRLWFACGYRPGISAYLNFFLLAPFITTHDDAFPARFHGFRSMADSFYRTDLFIRDVTDSGPVPTGGISAPAVRAALAKIMKRHRVLDIPRWMMTYFGFSLVETVELQVGGLDVRERGLHLGYMATTYRIMGLAFSADRAPMERFARAVERAHAGSSPRLRKHAANILLLGEMIGVRSDRDTICTMLPQATRRVFEPLHRSVRPPAWQRLGARLVGRLVMKRAVGQPRAAVPYGSAGVA